ncbi:MAG: membrane dipeptidase [Planctomycetota bacterium]
MRPVFDLHCDALQRALDLGHDLGGETHGHFDLAKATRGGVRAVSLTAWVDGTYADEPGAAKRRTNALLDAADDLFARHPERVRRVTTAAELDATPDGTVACVLAIEGGHALEHYAARGVRVLTLTWNNHLSWARSCRDGAPAGTPEGLSALGRDIVREMGRLGIAADLSHAGERTFFDALEVSERPPLVTHSGCRALTDHPRNVTDAQLRALAERGGVLGIPFATAFLDDEERAQERAHRKTDAFRGAGRGGATERLLLEGDAIQAGLEPFPIEHVVRHTLHALEVMGPDHVAIGSDFDGIDRRPAGLEDASGYPALLDALETAGVDDETLDKVAFTNAARALT